MYKLEISEGFAEDINAHKKHGNKKLVKKIERLVTELEQHPRTGTGKVERLKHYPNREIYSRRIDSEHRLVYEIIDDQVIIILISAFGHY